MNILIVAHFTQMPSEKGNNRFNYLANLLGKSHKVELVTSSFSHKMKKQRNMKEEPIQELNYKLTIIYEPGYKKNVSIRRFYSHYFMGKNLKRYLRDIEEIPDVIYCAVPSLDAAKTVTQYAKSKGIRLIIDIQDLWPEAFKMVFRIPVISNIIFAPMKAQANYIYKQANDVIAVSDTYLKRAKKINKQIDSELVCFLGTELQRFDKYIDKNGKKEGEIVIAYVGTLGHSYDIPVIIEAIKKIEKKKMYNIKFLIMGDGPLRKKFEKYAKTKCVNAEFTGMLKYNEMVKRLSNCNIAVNPIKKGSAGSIVNKVADYAMAGLPVINTQECEEYRDIVKKYKIGFNCDNGNVKDIAKKIEILCNDKMLREEFGDNNRKLAKDKFDRTKTYKDIISLIEGNDE